MAKALSKPRQLSLSGIDMSKKRCLICKKRKPLNQFNNRNGSKDGKENTCKACERKRDRDRVIRLRREGLCIRCAKPVVEPGYSICLACREKFSARDKRKRRIYPERYMWYKAKRRAKKNNLDFNISVNDISIPKICPVLGISLEIGWDDKDNSPSLDRIDNTKGYIRGNIAVISYRANSIKRDGTAEEHQKIADWMKAHLGDNVILTTRKVAA